MSLSNDDSPESFYLKNTAGFNYQNEGHRLSNFIRDTDKLIRFRRVKVDHKNESGVKLSSFSPDNSVGALFLDINPKSFSIGMTKAVNDSSYTRAGFVPQFWGDELDTISAQGTTAAFIHTNEGVTRQKAGETAGFKNFIGLLLFYKNNGSDLKKFSATDTKKTINNTNIKTIASIKSTYKMAAADKNQAFNFITSSPRKIVDSRYLIELKYL
ncbi:hypothetical protein EBS02_02045, partial [bacterium]|nr:hypothetical protein [bacterium]